MNNSCLKRRERKFSLGWELGVQVLFLWLFTLLLTVLVKDVLWAPGSCQTKWRQGALIRKPERTTLTSLLSTGLSIIYGVCVCVCVCVCVLMGTCTLGVWMGVKDPSIKFSSFSFMLTLTQHAAMEFTVREIKMQRKVVTFGNCHSSLGKYTPTHKQGCYWFQKNDSRMATIWSDS